MISPAPLPDSGAGPSSPLDTAGFFERSKARLLEKSSIFTKSCAMAPAGPFPAPPQVMNVADRTRGARMPDLPPLAAFDSEDLAVIAANLQDAVVRVADMAYLPREKQFALVAGRFDWIKAASEGSEGGCERCQTGLRFGRVLKVSCRGFCHRDKDLVLNLLHIGFEATNPPSGVVEFIFSAGRALRLEVECLEAEIRDLGVRWKTKSIPCHQLDTAVGT